MPATGDEVARLAKVLNGLLGRVEQASAEQLVLGRADEGAPARGREQLEASAS